MSLAGSTGVKTVAPPTRELEGQFHGLALKVFSGHAFCSDVRREGSCLGNVTLTERMLACGPGA